MNDIKSLHHDLSSYDIYHLLIVDNDDSAVPMKESLYCILIELPYIYNNYDSMMIVVVIYDAVCM